MQGRWHLHNIQPFCTKVRWEGFEPSTSGFVDRSSVHLSYQRVKLSDYLERARSISVRTWRVFSRISLRSNLTVEGMPSGPPMRRGVLDSPPSRLSAGCSASELTARDCVSQNAVFHAYVTSVRRDTCATSQQWANVGSNHGPSACRADALAAELQAQRFLFPVLKLLSFDRENSRP